MKSSYPRKTAYMDAEEEIILKTLILPSPLSDIARAANLPRSTAEYNLKKLVLKKLVKVKVKRKRKMFYRTSKQYNNLNQTNHPILELPDITLYRGRKSIGKLWSEIAHLPKGSRLMGIQPRKSFGEAIKRSSRNVVQGISQLITDRGFIVDLVVHKELVDSIFDQYGDSVKDVAKAFTKRREDMVKVPRNVFDEKAEFFVIDEYLIFIDWFSETAFKIRNTNMINLMKSVYAAAKAHGNRYSAGEYIEKLININSKPNT